MAEKVLVNELIDSDVVALDGAVVALDGAVVALGATVVGVVVLLELPQPAATKPVIAATKAIARVLLSSKEVPPG
jgi:hypothetical protein